MEKILYTILDDAIERSASDIHFMPGSDLVIIKMRIYGEMHPYDTIAVSQFEKLLSYLKFETHLDVSEKNKAQSGMLSYKKNSEIYNVRASTLPQSVGNEACVLRIIPAMFNQTATVEQSLLQLMHKGSGLILISGPTGSGKSTLLYQLLQYAVSKLNKQIIAIEDPVEQQIEGIVQINVNEKANITYQNSLKAILRCDPDIIMIGEIRDAETAKNVVNASLSGHLVLSTIHANTCLGALHRLLEMGVTQVELEQCAEIIINQRLVNTKLERKRVFETLTRKDVSHYLNQQSLQLYEPITSQLSTLKAEGLITQMEFERYALE
ncbi:competence type IV pilus ATPase ComGA [Macrococcus capreoli]|uniref:competence type IV pilus ATPase ComGA n=1 Tax=Macrococcus capreoli TaxID=2982690 RepID=UPI0021D59B0D|nr:competence type IV pilus ATPase ComGA [Macrococcus sp. TMW 2.2395]MCU7556836.1 competence type IV pilus ATPase ComGA [Macrococcus sp. TMW 2.2395]